MVDSTRLLQGVLKLKGARQLALSFIIALCAPGLMVSAVQAAETKKPLNILIMVSDDQRWDQLGVVQAEQGERARFPFLQTPRLDALAAAGMRFRNAFVTDSLCSPSRSAMLTGQYNHTNGIIDNFTPFSPRPTWATALQAAGYTTAYIGKWHHGEMQLERPGFDYVATYAGQGQYYDATFKVSNELRPKKMKGYVDSRSVDFAIEFLQKQPRDKPFAMMIGFKASHQPFTPMAENAHDYSGDTIRPARNWDALPPFSALKKPIPWRRPPPMVDWQMDILRTIEGVDTNVGRVLDALSELDLANNTLVIFASDNGYHLGERGMGDKRSAYEESMRVPLIMRLPGVIEPGTVSDAMVLNIDFAPTILDMAGQEIPAAMHGRSVRPLFGPDPVAWRDSFLYEYWQENTFWQRSKERRVPTILAVRTPRYKLITYPDYKKWTELFDLEADPDETRNLVGYSDYLDRHIELCKLLQQQLDETHYIAKPSPDTWLVGLSNSYFPAQEHARQPVTVRRPPLRIPSC
jgi:arylsulfatase A-like enzyme